MTLLAGAVLLVAGLIASVAGAHFKARRYFDRPAPARNRFFDPFLTLLKWCCLAAGLTLIGRASRASLAAAAGLLAGLWGYRRFIRSHRFQGWLVRRDYEALRKRRPGVPAREILYELVYRRNPRWGEELIEQMILDYPDVESLARIIAKMERGFRGFR